MRMLPRPSFDFTRTWGRSLHGDHGALCCVPRRIRILKQHMRGLLFSAFGKVRLDPVTNPCESLVAQEPPQVIWNRYYQANKRRQRQA